MWFAICNEQVQEYIEKNGGAGLVKSVEAVTANGAVSKVKGKSDDKTISIKLKHVVIAAVVSIPTLWGYGYFKAVNDVSNGIL